MDYNLVFVLTFLILAEADFELASPTIPQRSLRELVSKRRQLNYLKTILQDLDNKLEKLEKRSCPINIPGMDCDYGYIKGTGKDHNIWMSEIGPGKKRRKRLCAFNLPGMNCEFPEIVGIGKDTSAWNNGEGPGRKRSRDRSRCNRSKCYHDCGCHPDYVRNIQIPFMSSAACDILHYCGICYKLLQMSRPRVNSST